jgi:hypothetical protein
MIQIILVTEKPEKRQKPITMKTKKTVERKPVGESAFCTKCGRGVETVEGYFVEHHVRGITSQVVKICKGSFTLAGYAHLTPAEKSGNLTI